MIKLHLFTTITNASFDDEAITAKIVETLTCRILNGLTFTTSFRGCKWSMVRRVSSLLRLQAQRTFISTENEDVRSLRELVLTD